MKKKKASPKTREELEMFIEYELSGRCWTGFINWDWLQELVAAYIAKRTQKKYKRYKLYLIRKAQGINPHRV